MNLESQHQLDFLLSFSSVSVCVSPAFVSSAASPSVAARCRNIVPGQNTANSRKGDVEAYSIPGSFWSTWLQLRAVDFNPDQLYRLRVRVPALFAPDGSPVLQFVRVWLRCGSAACPAFPPSTRPVSGLLAVQRAGQRCSSWSKQCGIQEYAPPDYAHGEPEPGLPSILRALLRFDGDGDGDFGGGGGGGGGGVRTAGRFVEIGSYDCHYVSFTSFLADLGWRGVYVDPVAEHLRMCAARHWGNDVALVTAAAGAHGGVWVNLTTGGPYSTAIPDMRQLYTSGAVPFIAQFGMSAAAPQRRVEQRTVDDILGGALGLRGYGRTASPADVIDVMVVDVEGGELSVLHGMDVARWAPRVIIMELTDDHPWVAENPALLRAHAARVRQARRLLTQRHGYVEVYRSHINTIFLRAATPISSGVEK